MRARVEKVHTYTNALTQPYHQKHKTEYNFRRAFTIEAGRNFWSVSQFLRPFSRYWAGHSVWPPYAILMLIPTVFSSSNPLWLSSACVLYMDVERVVSVCPCICNEMTMQLVINYQIVYRFWRVISLYVDKYISDFGVCWMLDRVVCFTSQWPVDGAIGNCFSGEL